MTPEGQVEDYLGKLCKQYDVLYYKFTSPGVRGVPDRILIGQGKTVFVELKRPGGKPRLSQTVVFNRIKSHGGKLYVVDSKISAIILMKKLFKPAKKTWQTDYAKFKFKVNQV